MSRAFPAGLSKPDLLLYGLTISLLVFALFFNLDAHHMFVHTDEPRRALVALEMMLSGDFVTPTLNGAYYFNKPPLYNWIIAASFALFGNYSEFALRFPVVVSILLFGVTIFLFTRIHLGGRNALLVALAFATCGRVLFYDSVLGLMDITFAWVVYAGMMVLFQNYEKGRFYSLFVLTYFLTAIGFLMKGFPALVYQGISLLTLFTWRRDLKRLVSFSHLTGIGVFIVIVGTFYLVYIVKNDVPPSTLFMTLWEESAKRTPLERNTLDVVSHVFTFPFEMLMHFLPWTFLLVTLYQRELVAKISSNPFVKFNALFFLANIPVYWISPEVYPRYLFVFVPLAVTVLVHLYNRLSPEAWQRRLVNVLFVFVLTAALIFALTLPFAERNQSLQFVYAKSGLLFLGLALALSLFHKIPANRFIAAVFGLAVIRIGFDWFDLPLRNGEQAPLKTAAMHVGAITKGAPLYILGNATVHDGTTFYIERERGGILRRRDEVAANTFFIVNDNQLKRGHFENLYSFKTVGYTGDLHLVKIPPTTTVNNE